LIDDIDDQVLTFAVSASTPENLAYFKEVMKNIIRRYGGSDVVKINVVPFGSDPSPNPITFDSSKYPDEESLFDAIDNMTIPSGDPSLIKTLDEVKKILNEQEISEDTKKNLVVMSDKKATDTPEEIALSAQRMEESAINIYTVPLNSEGAKDNELLNGEKEASVSVNPASDNPVSSAEEIMAEVGEFVLSNGLYF